MRIERIRQERDGARTRIAADVVWEDREARPATLAIEAMDPFGSDLEPSPDAFLVALLPIAQWQGEKRVLVDGPVCCRLRDGLRVATELFSIWYDRCRPLTIETTRGFSPTVARSEPRAASLLSGGIDSLSLLRSNRLDYPSDHPASIRDSILLFGLNTYDLDASGPRNDRLAAFEAYTQRLTTFAEHADVTLIVIHTNIRSFYPDFQSWLRVGYAAGMVSAALCQARRIDRVELGSAGLGMRTPPGGSHLFLDHLYSTEAVAVRHAQGVLGRFDKTRIVAEWPEALSVVRSCLYHKIPVDGRINCGECDKCVRTMLALLLLGKLDSAPAFPFDDVTPAMLEPLRIENAGSLLYLTECADQLSAAERSDLAEPLRRKLAAYDRAHGRRKKVSFAKKTVVR